MRPTIDKDFSYSIGDPIIWVTKFILNK
jgi:hypothetical protein